MKIIYATAVLFFMQLCVNCADFSIYYTCLRNCNKDNDAHAIGREFDRCLHDCEKLKIFSFGCARKCRETHEVNRVCSRKCSKEYDPCRATCDDIFRSNLAKEPDCAKNVVTKCKIGDPCAKKCNAVINKLESAYFNCEKVCPPSEYVQEMFP